MDYQLFRVDNDTPTLVSQGECEYQPTESMASFPDWWENSGEAAVMAGVPQTGGQHRLVLTQGAATIHRHTFDW